MVTCDLPDGGLIWLLANTKKKMLEMEMAAETETARFDTLCDQARQIHWELQKRGLETDG